MDFAANFTAIDFETANQRADSACQLAAVIVREGQFVDSAMWMIRPQPCYFSRSNIRIHGITPERVRSKPVFGDVWPDIAEKLGDDCLVAHNASFDIGVLLACLRSHDQPIPELEFTCTRAIARRTWPHHRRYGLKPLANWLGIRFRHHDALEDSIACAKILLAAGMDREATSLVDLEKQLSLKRGKAGSWGHRGPTGRSGRRTNRSGRPGRPSGAKDPALWDTTGKDGSTRRGPAIQGGRDVQHPLPFLFPDQIAESQTDYQVQAITEPTIDLQRLMIRAEFIRPLQGQRVVFSGELRAITRQEAQSLAIRSGGTCSPQVDESTDYLVIGGQKGAARLRCEAEQTVRKIETDGKQIQIVDEEEFFGLLGAASTD